MSACGFVVAIWPTTICCFATLLVSTTVSSAWKWAQSLGGPGLILLGIFDNTPLVSAPPGSMDIAVILLSAHQSSWWAYFAFMATLGEVMGGYLTYHLAEKGGQETFEKKLGKGRAEKLYALFGKYGAIAVFVGAIVPPPFPFTTVVMTAGVMQYPRRQFFAALTAGRTIRFLIVSWFGRIYSQPMIAFFARRYRSLLLALITIAVVAIMGELLHYLHKRSRAAVKSESKTAPPGNPYRQESKP